MTFKEKLKGIDTRYFLGKTSLLEWRREFHHAVYNHPCDHCGQVGHREELHREKLKETTCS